MSKKNLFFLMLLAFAGLQNSVVARVGTQTGLHDTQIAQVKKIVEAIQAQQLTSHEVELLLKEVVAEEKVETIGSLGFLETLGAADPLLLVIAGIVVAGGGLYWAHTTGLCSQLARSYRTTAQDVSRALTSVKDVAVANLVHSGNAPIKM